MLLFFRCSFPLNTDGFENIIDILITYGYHKNLVHNTRRRKKFGLKINNTSTCRNENRDTKFKLLNSELYTQRF